jgi:SAM-dependent methyltransferase
VAHTPNTSLIRHLHLLVTRYSLRITHHVSHRARRIWHRLIIWAFRQLYTSFAWAYDAVAWAVSRGRWQEWGQAALPHVKGPRVLEIGSGPGHLLASLAAAGFAAAAVDVSPQMVRQAARLLKRRNLSAHLVHARAQAMPWPTAHFDSVVMTFPAGFIADPRAHTEIHRVLAGDGRLVVVDGAELQGGVYGKLIELAFRVTHGGGSPVRLAHLLEMAGFTLHRRVVHWPDSSVTVLVGRRAADG